jgi:serine/threonine-protein kinase
VAFAPNTRIGPYSITAQIGAGGMGVVYRAKDGNLNRDVAIKVLTESLANDPDRVARFQREAQLLAALNHPNIAQIHGLERSDGAIALVMEFVDGPTLADRIFSGALPVDEALAIARQIAEALDAAHQQGIIHRDLKPANIKVRPDGTVKVLDFGLAKALSPSDSGQYAHAAAGVTVSPTVTTPALTHVGIILGTAAYMSPEQAKGRTLDARTDVWAWGCVVFEMLTGRRAFPGNEVADVLGAVIHKDPAWEMLPPTLPPVVRSFLRRCLAKVPTERVRDMGDLRLALEGAFDVEDSSRVPARRPGVWWMAASAVLAAIVSGLAVWGVRPDPPRPIRRFTHTLPGDQSFSQTGRPLLAVAPDGSALVYVANSRLYRRTMGEFEATPIRGTDGVPSGPFFSPDGQTIGYWDFAAKQLKAVSIAGGTPIALAGAASFYSASWGADDTIVYGQEDGIWRVRATGGTPEHLVTLKPGERVHGPQMLPNANAVLFTLVSVGSLVGQAGAWDNAQVMTQSLDTGERTMLVRGSDARYIPTGHLVFALSNTLLAVRFDAANRRIIGRPIPIVERIQRPGRTPGSSGSANYDFSIDGTLVYVALDEASVQAEKRGLVAVDLQGDTTPLVDEQRQYWRPRISPDGTRVLVEVIGPGGSTTQLWIVDPAKKLATPLTSDEQETPFAAWTPDGKSVVYRSNPGGRLGIYKQAADGSGDAELLFASESETVPTDISRSGVLTFAQGPQTGERLIRLLELDSKSVSDFLDTPAWEHMSMFSPDGRWMAYTSNESGQMEVYVRPYPRAPGVGRRVSLGGGEGPVWAPDGRTLYYRGRSGDLMAVETTLSPGFTSGRPKPLFRFNSVFVMSGNTSAYDIHPDGKRFIMVTADPNRPPAVDRIHIVQNWFDELKRQVPGD